VITKTYLSCEELVTNMETKHGVDVMDQYDDGVDFTEDDYERLTQDDDVEEGAWIAKTPKGTFEVPGNMPEGYLADQLGVETQRVNMRQYRNDDSRTSASATRASEEQFSELSGIHRSSADILGDRVQEKSGQSTPTVQEEESPSIDRID
jgi:hypothetical protein